MARIHTLTLNTDVSSHNRMPALLRKFNYRNVTLTDDTEAENVGVLDDTGVPHYFPWLGFIESTSVLENVQAVHVRLESAAYSSGDGCMEPWSPVPDGMYVSGCQVGRGVYGICENGVPRLV